MDDSPLGMNAIYHKNTFACSEYRTDGIYATYIFAESWNQAQKIADATGMFIDGELYATITGIDDSVAHEMIDFMNEEKGAHQ
jgi:hypothetical protein